MGYKYNPFIGNFDRVGPGSGGAAIETLTGNSGGAVGPDGAFNINILGAGSLTVTGNPGTNTLTIDDDGTLASLYTADAGSAIPAAGNLNLFGTAAQGLSTSAAGNTVTFTNADATETQKGVSELATDPEAIAGADSTRTIVPTSLKAKLGVQTNFSIPFGQGNTSVIGWTSALDDGEIVIGANGANPVATTITPGNGISITNAANFIRIDTTASVATTYTTDSGNAVPVAHVLNVLGGTNVSTSGAGNTVTINATGFASFTWSEVTMDTAMLVNNGYIANKAGTATAFTLPATAAVGDVLRVAGKGATGWTIGQNAGQTIHFGTLSTTTGVGGSLASTDTRDSVELLCETANTDFVVLSSVGVIIVT